MKTSNLLEFGIIGLGKMGANLSLQALEKGLGVAGYDIGAISTELLEKGLRPAKSLQGLLAGLTLPRKIFLYVPAGPIVDQLLEELSALLSPGDILVDGGNSYWGDSIRRQRRAAQRGLHWVDLGTSGGIEGARRGACFMAGGEAKAIRALEPILLRLCIEGGYVHAGGPGAGHFAKLVHNGIEFGMLQAIGEGLQLLEAYTEALPIGEILECWRHGSVIRSWLIDLMARAWREEGGFERIPAYVEDTGEVNWLISDALRMEVPIPVISQSVMQLLASRDSEKDWARAIAMMRHEFGGHPYGQDAAIQRERREGRVGDFFKEEVHASPERKAR